MKPASHRAVSRDRLPLFKFRSYFLIAAMICAACSSSATPLRADDTEGAKKHLLRYKFTQGETVRMKVLHLASTETRIRGNLQSSRSRGLSIKQWKVTDVADDGTITIEHSVASADMSNEVTGRAKVTFNSKTDKHDQAPVEYQHVAESIGKVIAEVKFRPNGEIVEQEQKYKQHSFGMGQMIFPLPEEAAPIGHQWFFPTEITVQLPNGQKKRIKTRQRYILKKVAHGLATIEVTTQVLTPVTQPQVEVQLMQQVTNGVVKFDIDAGRVVNQRMDWDEEAVGFNGAQSTMQYLARFEESLIDGEDEDSLSEDAKPAVEPKVSAVPAGPSLPEAPKR